MIENLPDVPPALLLLLQETAACESLGEMRKRIRQLLPELRDQSEAFALASRVTEDARRGALRFEVHVHGGLDLLSGQGCSDPGCRFAAADRLARSIGLIADRVWLTDSLSERFIHFGRSTNRKLEKVIGDTLVLKRLLPLILAGVVRFRSPWIATCSDCHSAVEGHIEGASKSLAKVFRRDFKVRRTPNGGWVAETGQCATPSMVYWNPAVGKPLVDCRRGNVLMADAA